MTLYTTKQLADSMRTVRNNTINIAQDIPEESFDFRPSPDSRSVRETLLHLAATAQFDFQVHQQERRASMAGFDFKSFLDGMTTKEKQRLGKDEILQILRDEGDRWCKWVEGVSDLMASESVEMPAGTTPPTKNRFEMLLARKEHEMHHRAQLMVIERMLGIVPHLTRNRQAALSQAAKDSQ
jgi:uncharacterized damage-inducible protein DinB